MVTNNPKDLPLATFRLLFHGEELIYKGKKVPLRKINLRAGGTLRKVEVGDFAYIEQNPSKRSKWAAMARRGHNILWIINTRTNEYWGRVVDGEVTPLRTSHQVNHVAL